MQHISIDPSNVHPPTRDGSVEELSQSLPSAKASRTHPSKSGGENASIYFVGTATTILEWHGVRIMTDPNFLHAGDHVHLGPGVSSMRKTNPAVDLHDLPRIDLVLLSHYHGDHFDHHVEASLRRSLPIITTSHARSILTSKGTDSFTNIYDLEPFQQMMITIKADGYGPAKAPPALRVTGMPGKHVPVAKPIEKLNEFVGAIPPTNGWLLELGHGHDAGDFVPGYRIYITGDTLLVDELKEIPRRYGGPGKNIDLMLIHLGGTTVPHPSLSPFTLMVTMDAAQGVELMRLVKPEVTIPIHYDDYDVFASSLEEFKGAVEKAGFNGGGGGVVFLDRGEEYRFAVRQ
ncbi:beta-lactamase superfamily domain-containing protein [Aspergillus pseudoustus]|uniref:Beta-lactamase superfamily domain-containing protein n=1 Tax=Aspergillus pseudoustus TaxID=1810923 RepID=A0ABR4K714_9EURO